MHKSIMTTATACSTALTQLEPENYQLMVRRWTQVMKRQRRRRSSSGGKSISTLSTITELEDSLSSAMSKNSTTKHLKSCIKLRTQEHSLQQMYGRSHSEQDMKRSERPAVTFSRLFWHMHEVQLGDNPSVTSGPPMALSSRCLEHWEMSVTEYESGKQSVERSKQEMLLPRWVREDMLRAVGYSRQEMRDADRAVQHVREQRARSARDGMVWCALHRQVTALLPAVLRKNGGSGGGSTMAATGYFDAVEAKQVKVDK